MNAELKISFHQSDEYTECINKFVDNLYQNKSVEVSFDDMNTLITGEYENIMKILKDELLYAYQTSGKCTYSLQLDITFL